MPQLLCLCRWRALVFLHAALHHLQSYRHEDGAANNVGHNGQPDGWVIVAVRRIGWVARVRNVTQVAGDRSPDRRESREQSKTEKQQPCPKQASFLSLKHNFFHLQFNCAGFVFRFLPSKVFLENALVKSLI